MTSAQDPGLLVDGVARFVPEGVDPGELPRSFAFVEPLRVVGAVPDDWATRPVFSRAGDDHVAHVAIEPGTSLYGTGEVAGRLMRNGYVTDVWAKQPFRIEDGTPVPNYDDRSPSLYQAHPWVLGVRADGSAFGILADTTFKLQIDLRDGIRLSAEVPFPVVVFEGGTPQEVVCRLSELTGRIELPPRWALGYHQCRFSYFPDARVLEVAEGFRSRDIPCDVMWVDIHYMDAYKVFTFDPEGFPDPRGTNERLHDLGFRSVWILDPAVKVEEGYDVYEEGVAEGHFLRDEDGSEYHAWTWPGDAAFPDYTRPETREWWTRLTQKFLENDMDGVWVDLNEPSPILPHGAELPDSLRHVGGDDIAPGSHAQYHNVYGMLMSQATHEAMRAARPERRPFVLTRSTYIGGQRYAATWTGDNGADWDHLFWSVPMVLNLGLSGQPNSGPDIGGFAGTPSPELFARWIGMGAFLPFCRTHNSLKGDQEPWSFGPEVEAIAKAALGRRYRLLPYLYTLFFEASTTGLPVARPVFFADPADPALRDEDHAFLLGADLLVSPQLEPTPGRVPALPSGRWRSLRLVDEDPDREHAHPVLRLREGAILPVGPGGQTTDEAFEGPITLFVSLDESGRARGRLYEDSGDGLGHLDGDFSLTTYEAVRDGDDVEVRVVAHDGRRPPARKDNLRVVVL